MRNNVFHKNQRFFETATFVLVSKWNRLSSQIQTSLETCNTKNELKAKKIKYTYAAPCF
jgi:hypothetical protein